MRGARLTILSTTACAAFASACQSAVAPMDYLHADGRMGKAILPLTQGLLIVSAVVVVIIAALVLIAILRRGRTGVVAGTQITEGDAKGWISIGVGLSTIVLVGLVVWTSVTMARIANPPSEPALSIEVRGHQWWWEFAYLNDNPSKTFVTANELHIPVGKPVRFDLKGEDVIHTFWVPSSRRKDPTDSRPNQCHLARGRQARRLSRPVLAILRPAARPYGFLGDRRSARSLRGLARWAAPRRLSTKLG